MSQTFTLAITPELGALQDAQAAIVAFGRQCALPGRIQTALDLVADEVISNIIRHGFSENQADRRITCEAMTETGAFILVFVDNGRPFDPLSDAPPPDLDSSIEDRAVGGLGVHIVKTLVDRCSYARDGGDNRLKLEWSKTEDQPG